MRKHMSKDERSLRQLADALADDALELSESELDEIIAGRGGTPSDIVHELRSRAQGAIQQVRREPLEVARRGYALASQASAQPRSRRRTRDEMLAIIDRLMASPEKLPAALTLAAREGRTQSDADLYSLIEDLDALGLLEDDERS